MTHQTEIIIIGGLLRPWRLENASYYPGVREHFSFAQLDRILGLEQKARDDALTYWDKRFLARMYRKLIRTAA